MGVFVVLISVFLVSCSSLSEVEDKHREDKYQEENSDLIQQINESPSMDDEERKYWISTLPIMTDGQIAELRDILADEKTKLTQQSNFERSYSKEYSSQLPSYADSDSVNDKAENEPKYTEVYSPPEPEPKYTATDRAKDYCSDHPIICGVSAIAVGAFAYKQYQKKRTRDYSTISTEVKKSCDPFMSKTSEDGKSIYGGCGNGKTWECHQKGNTSYMRCTGPKTIDNIPVNESAMGNTMISLCCN